MFSDVVDILCRNSTLVSDVLSFFLVAHYQYLFIFYAVPWQIHLDTDSENLLQGNVRQLKLKSFHWVKLTC